MSTFENKLQKKERPSSPRSVARSNKAGIPQLVDNRPQASLQRKLQSLAALSPRAQQAGQLKAMIDNRPVQTKANKTGLPDHLKSGIESLSGMSMDHVRVHYNSSRPAQLNAHAYAQGSDIHVAAGQEQHVPHEAWHVVQQAQGRVRPTMQMKDKVLVNDDRALEREADVMGAKALQMNEAKPAPLLMPIAQRKTTTLQRMIDMRKFGSEEFAQINDIEALRRFISYGIVGKGILFINNRAQTFKQAVNEFIKTESPGYGDVQQKWLDLNRSKDVQVVKAEMRRIAEMINYAKARNPDHPNAPWSDQSVESGHAVEHEAPGTIPQTKESRAISNAIWNALDRDQGKMRKKILEGQLNFNGEQKTNFMIGVLVYPSGQVIVGVSGQLDRLDTFRQLCAGIVHDKGFHLKAVVDTNSLPTGSIRHYDKNFEVVRKTPVKDFKKEERSGNKPGSCAAAVVLGSEDVLDSAPLVRGDGKVLLGLTEVFTGRTALISNRLEPHVEPERWPREDGIGEYDVPSCETCQHQLDLFALNLVILNRKMRLEEHYPQQEKKLAQQLGHLEEEMATYKKNVTGIESELEKKKEKLNLLEEEEKRWDAAFQHEYMPMLQQKNQLSTVKDKLEEKQKMSSGEDKRKLGLISGYEQSKKEPNGKAPAQWWLELTKLVPALSKIQPGDRLTALKEFKENLDASSDEQLSDEIKQLKLEIEGLKQKMQLFQERKDEFSQHLMHAKEAYQESEKELKHLRKSLQRSEKTFKETGEKLERYPLKRQREHEALKTLTTLANH